MMDAGQLKYRVAIERQAQAATSFAAQEWVLVSEVWGGVRAKSSREQYLADAMQSSVTHTVIVRWSLDLDASTDAAAWRIKYRDRQGGADRTMAVVGPPRLYEQGGKAGKFLVFDCMEGMADGH
jgi:SPP1 family predicted phage head-tail adaptor